MVKREKYTDPSVDIRLPKTAKPLVVSQPEAVATPLNPTARTQFLEPAPKKK